MACNHSSERDGLCVGRRRHLWCVLVDACMLYVVCVERERERERDYPGKIKRGGQALEREREIINNTS
jgi:hypothetical protein